MHINRFDPSARVARGFLLANVLVAGLVVGMLLLSGCVASADAAEFPWYWYNGNAENCWQTGTLGAESKACDNTGALFLTVPGRAYNDTEGGISKDFGLSPSGDYCSYYDDGGTLNQKDPNSVSGSTGFPPPTPLENYQESNGIGGNETVCQAYGDTFGFQVTDSAAGNNCHKTCGMHHYVSFTGQGEKNKPWNEAFGSPSLVISAHAGVPTFTASGSYFGGWAYVCPELKDTTTGGILEYCLQEWRSTNNTPEWKDERIGECNSGFSQINTFFYPGTQFATKVGGESTYVGGTFGTAHFEAKITKENLENAIKLVNSSNNGEGGHPKPGVGCGWGLSTHPENYALIGVEQGMEGWDGLEKLATNATNLQLHTEYTPRPQTATPYAFREPSTGNEDIFFRGIDNTLWQDAWTSSGGWQKNRIGGTLTSDPMGFIEPNGTMNIFYRGTNDAIWQAYRNSSGAWSEYEVLSGAPLSAGKPYGYMQSNGTMNIFYCSTSHVISQLYFSGSSWSDPGMAVGEAAPCEGDPVALVEANGNQNVFYRTTTGSVGQVWWSGSVGWHSNPLGGDMEGTPSALQESNGNMNVFFHKAGNELGQWWSGSSGWDETPLGGVDLQNPVAFLGSTGTQNVFFVNHYGTIGRWWLEEGHGWQETELGEASEGSPTGFAQPNGDLNVYFFQGGTGAIDQWLYSSGKWNLSTVCAAPCS